MRRVFFFLVLVIFWDYFFGRKILVILGVGLRFLRVFVILF